MATPSGNKAPGLEEKVKGNDEFKAGRYGPALRHYSKAIKLEGDNAVYYRFVSIVCSIETSRPIQDPLPPQSFLLLLFFCSLPSSV